MKEMEMWPVRAMLRITRQVFTLQELTGFMEQCI